MINETLTLKCIRGVQLDRRFRFNSSPVKSVSFFHFFFFFFFSCPKYQIRIFWWEKWKGCGVSGNWHKSALLRNVTKIVLKTEKFYFSNLNLFMFFFFEPYFIEKFLLKKCFVFKFWSCDYFYEIEISILAAILKPWFFFPRFMVGCFKCIQILCKFRAKILLGKQF